MLLRLTFFVCFFILPSAAHAWLESGHHVIAVLAFEDMADKDQAELLRILTQHPQYELYFTPTQELTDQAAIDRWRIGTAAYWPDIVRGTDYDRPTWHYQLAANYVIGEVVVPEPPGPLPPTATLNTKELFIAQAFELCLRVFQDVSQPESERAIALCWLMHLVADGHLPCHVGSLYADHIFPAGDRGANLIETSQGNLHFVWDNLLGKEATPDDVIRRVQELRTVQTEPAPSGAELASWTSAKTWLAESAALANVHLYTDEVMGPITAASRGLIDELPTLQLSDEYFLAAGRAARNRARLAASRLSVLLVPKDRLQP